MDRTRSRKAFERSIKTFAGGVGSAGRLFPEPLFIDRGKGSRVIDIDGNEYIDYVIAFGPLILGHCPEVVMDAVSEQLGKGTMFGASHELEFLVSEKVAQLVPCIDLVRFTCSGSEAIHFALRLARAYTGRPKVIKFEGHYHGWYDNVYVSVKPSPPVGLPNAPWKVRGAPGQPENVVDNLVIVPWNDLEAVESALEDQGHEIAAVIAEPVMFNNGGIGPEEGYLSALREVTSRHGVVLIFDEIVTGFRLALGGAQEYFGVTPDLCVFGKGLAAGYPISGFGGRREIMELVATNQVAHFGTFNSNPLCLAAALATLEELSRDDGQVMQYVSAVGAKLRTGLNELFGRHGFPMRADGCDSIFVLNSPVLELRNYRDFMGVDAEFVYRFYEKMFNEGVWFMRRGNMMLSAAHTEEDVQQTLEAAERVIKSW
ncbi:MAG TPA: aspartate aminotransferase family protein [Anaerolineae bacterium]|nr:aspartate aminotransferase family protein [Anaerolineae bacterium]